MKKGLQLSVQKVTWAGTQCSDFFPQARHIFCQYINNFAAFGLNPFYVLNILIRTARKSVIANMPLSAVYNQKMAAIDLVRQCSPSDGSGRNYGIGSGFLASYLYH